MDKVVALIDKYRLPDGTYEGGFLHAPEDEEFIQRAEQVLGYRLPDDYRRFVSTYATGGILGLEIYGVFRNKIGEPDFTPGVPDAVGLTLEAREKYGWHPDYLYIAYLGDGEEVRLNMRSGSVTSERPNGRGRFLGTSFGEWLLEALEEREEWFANDDDASEDDDD